MTAPRALSGLRVIDLTRVLGGPYCTMILADHGADVVKVEPPGGDETRDWGPPFLTRADGTRDASYFLGVNRGKRAVAIDLARPEGRDILLRMLDGADVLTENFKPGTLERWGIGHAALAERYPRLIHCRVSGFGADGPLGGLEGYDAILQAMSGLMSVNGTPGTGPMRLGTPVVDLATGLYSATAILMALHERARSGLGQFIDMTLHDCALALLHPQAPNYFLSGREPGGTGNPHPNLAPYDRFHTATCDIFVASGNNGQFRKLCALLGDAALAHDPRFATNAARLENRKAMTRALAALLAEHDGEAIADALIRGGVPAGPVRTVGEALAHPHAAHREMVATVGDTRVLNTPIRFSRTPGGAERASPAFAADTDGVLARFGYDADAIAALERDGVVGRRRA